MARIRDIRMINEYSPYDCRERFEWTGGDTAALLGGLGGGGLIGGLSKRAKGAGIGSLAGGCTGILTAGLRTVENRESITEDEIAADGCVMCLPLDENEGGHAHDFSGHGNDMVLGSGDRKPAWTEGKHGYALSFNGETNFATAPAPSFNKDITVELEVYVIGPGVGPHAYGYPIIRWNGANGGSFIFRVQKDYSPVLWITNSEDVKIIYAHPPLPKEKWNRIIISYNRDEYSLLYGLNGSIQDLGLQYNVPFDLTGGTIQFGKSFEGYLEYILSEVRLYKRALSRDEMKEHFLGSKLV